MSDSVFLSRYFYRVCQGTLFPNPVQAGRQLDKLPSDTRRNILSLSRVKMGSPLSPKPPFLSPNKPRGCQSSTSGSKASQDKQGSAIQTDKEKGQKSPSVPSHGEKHLSGLYRLAPSESDISPSTKDSEGLDETLQPSNLSLTSWMASTPLVTQTDGIQLDLPPDRASPCVKYSRSSEEGLCADHVGQPAHRTVQLAEQELHTAL